MDFVTQIPVEQAPFEALMKSGIMAGAVIYCDMASNSKIQAHKLIILSQVVNASIINYGSLIDHAGPVT